MFRNICLVVQLKTRIEVVTMKERIMDIFPGEGLGMWGIWQEIRGYSWDSGFTLLLHLSHSLVLAYFTKLHNAIN